MHVSYHIGSDNAIIKIYCIINMETIGAKVLQLEKEKRR